MQQRDEPATKFERFLLTKSAVRVREFYDFGALSGTLGRAKLVVARANARRGIAVSLEISL
jgi:hypothetical protein